MLVNELSVIDNILLGRGFGRLDRKGESERLEAMSRRLGLEISPAAIVGDLSVGQRQRVEIVKCLMNSPRVLV
ncbi:ATP-binding cassette domain-containing protein, partial [Rhizobium johnstonii]|uniref:ATP-binding cassette domain-containing protein n=1 Tax=Rhizobium johnstonii TaxID=3019933 RepID=UPI003F9E3565